MSLIGSDKVESTPVYGADDRKIGTVQRVMIDKISGKVAYAVISFGGFLGMGEDYYPMPWASLSTTPALAVIVSASLKTSSRALPNITATPSGIGLTAAGTRRSRLLSCTVVVRLMDQKAGRMPSSLLFSAPSCRNCDTTPLSRTIGVANHYRAEERHPEPAGSRRLKPILASSPARARSLAKPDG